MKVNTYATELGYGDFCAQCMQREARKHQFRQVELVCESNEPCSACGAKSE